MADKSFDIVIIGAGGAGMMCAMTAGRRGKSVLLIDHAEKIGKKILISGGGRCNFTNIFAGPEAYVSNNPHFAKSALARYTPGDFIELVEKHRIRYHEKKLGQLFCDNSAQEIVDMLVDECKQSGVTFWLNCLVKSILPPEEVDVPVFVSKQAESGVVRPPVSGDGHSPASKHGGSPVSGNSCSLVSADGALSNRESGTSPERLTGRFLIATTRGSITCEKLVIATGGLSVPKVGATGFGYDLARKFGLKVVETAPALDGFIFNEKDMKRYHDLQGVSADSVVSLGGASFRENILFTHRGLSGPASLQASLYWHSGENVSIDLCPDIDIGGKLKDERAEGSRKNIKNALSEWLPKRLAHRICEEQNIDDSLQHISDRSIAVLVNSIKEWKVKPTGTVGYIKAEVTRGGIDTGELSSRTMECKKIPGLYFIGEVVDVTGQLGGYNFQWAWASGFAAGESV